MECDSLSYVTGGMGRERWWWAVTILGGRGAPTSRGKSVAKDLSSFQFLLPGDVVVPFYLLFGNSQKGRRSKRLLVPQTHRTNRCRWTCVA